MGRSNFRKPKDGRSSRKARLATLARRLLGGFPLEPDRSVRPGSVRAPGIVRLVDEVHRYLHAARMSTGRKEGFRIVPGAYRELMAELVENRNDLGRLQGVYVIHEASGPQRALYVGSTWGASFRARLTSHLMPRGSLRHLGRILVSRLVALLESGQVSGEADEYLVDRALRRIVFGENRWIAESFARMAEEEHAVELVSVGAFDITLIVLPEDDRALAQFIEQRLVQVCIAECGQVPPLQRTRVVVSRKARAAVGAHGVAAAMLKAAARSAQAAETD